MARIIALFRKEVRMYWNSPIAYIFIIAFLCVTFWMFFQTFFVMGRLDLRPFFTFLPWMFLFLLPALTMKLWAEEYRQGTFDVLMSSSLSYFEAVIAKYLASISVLVLTLIATLTLPITLLFLAAEGSQGMDWGIIFTSYLGAFLLGSLYIAIGILMSALTENQIVAFIASVLITFIMVMFGEPIVLSFVPGFLAPIFVFLSPGAHYEALLRGVIALKDVVFFLSGSAFCLYLNILFLEMRK